MTPAHRSHLFVSFFSLTFVLLASCGGGSSGGSTNDLMEDSSSVVSPVMDAGGSGASENSQMGVQTGESEGAEVVVTENSDATPEPPVESEPTGSPSTISGNVLQFGVVDVEYSPGFDQTSLSAGFFGANLPVNADQLASQFLPDEDVCSVVDLDIDDDSGDFEIPDILDQVESLSAGEVIPFTSPSGSFAELTQAQAFGFTFYQLGDDLDSVAGPIPAGLEFSIPGDDFAAFNNIPVSVPEPLQVTTPAPGQPVSADTVFTWSRGNSESARLSISLFSARISVDCEVIDDGQFEFPVDVRAQLGDDFQSLFATISREDRRVFQNGSSVLFVTSSSDQ